jgi:hypothetical protein
VDALSPAIEANGFPSLKGNSRITYATDRSRPKHEGKRFRPNGVLTGEKGAQGQNIGTLIFLAQRDTCSAPRYQGSGMITIGPKVIIAGVATLALGAGTGVAAAAMRTSPSPVDRSGVIHGCWTNSAIHGSHVFELQDVGTNCPKGTTAISWNERGPAGAPGPSGPAGGSGTARVSSLDQLNGIPCDHGAGTTRVSYGSDGAVSIRCVTPTTPHPTAPVTPIPTTVPPTTVPPTTVPPTTAPPTTAPPTATSTPSAITTAALSGSANVTS